MKADNEYIINQIVWKLLQKSRDQLMAIAMDLGIITKKEHAKATSPLDGDLIDKARAIEIIEAHYTPDSPIYRGKALRLLSEAKEELRPSDWRDEPEEVLVLLAQKMLQIEQTLDDILGELDKLGGK